MFKRGGSSYEAQGTGITSPYDTPRKKYNIGTTYEDVYSKIRETTQDPRGDFSYASQGFSELGNPYKESGEAKTIGEMLYAGAAGVRGSREKASELEKTGELSILESQAGRLAAEEVATEQKRQFDAKLKQDRYLGEIAAKGKDEFRKEMIDKVWDARIADAPPSQHAEMEKKRLLDIDRYIIKGEDISDQFKILSNQSATYMAQGLAEDAILIAINPNTKVEWKKDDDGYAEALLQLYKKYLKITSEFLLDEEKKATGGRVGRSLGGGMTEDVNVMTKTPGGIADVNVSETIESDSGKTNEINISYEQLRDRLPPEISDEIVLLLSESYEAFADFAELQTQADVNEFNTKYNVQLFLPQQSGA